MKTSAYITRPKCGWKQAFKDKAFCIKIGSAFEELTLGYKIIWYLWSADVWFGNFPLLKFIVLVNVVIWIILFY